VNFATSALTSLHFPAGVVIGLVSAAPVGPINLLVIQRALTQNIPAALILGIGGALGDCTFAAIAAFGLGAAASLLHDHTAVIRIIGGLIMLAFAVFVWQSTPHLHDDAAQASPPRIALVAYGMVLTNPATLFFFVASFGAAGIDGIGHDTPAHRFNAALVVAGVFIGSMFWWSFISSVARSFRSRITDRHLAWLNRGTAAALALFGLAAVGVGALAA